MGSVNSSIFGWSVCCGERGNVFVVPNDVFGKESGRTLNFETMLFFPMLKTHNNLMDVLLRVFSFRRFGDAQKPSSFCGGFCGRSPLTTLWIAKFQGQQLVVSM